MLEIVGTSQDGEAWLLFCVSKQSLHTSAELLLFCKGTRKQLFLHFCCKHLQLSITDSVLALSVNDSFATNTSIVATLYIANASALRCVVVPARLRSLLSNFVPLLQLSLHS